MKKLNVDTLNFIKKICVNHGIEVLLTNYSHLKVETKELLMKRFLEYIKKDLTYVFPIDEKTGRLFPSLIMLKTHANANGFKNTDATLPVRTEPITGDKVYVAYDIPELHRLLNWRDTATIRSVIICKLEQHPLESLSDFMEFEEMVRQILISSGIFSLDAYVEIMLLYENLFNLLTEIKIGQILGVDCDTQPQSNYRMSLEGMLKAERNHDISGMVEMEMLFRSLFTPYETLLELTQYGERLFTIRCLSANHEFYSINLNSCFDKVFDGRYKMFTVSNMSDVLNGIATRNSNLKTNLTANAGLPREVKEYLNTINVREVVAAKMRKFTNKEISPSFIDFNISEDVLRAFCYLIHEGSSDDEMIFYDPDERLYIRRADNIYSILFTTTYKPKIVYAVSIYPSDQVSIVEFDNLHTIGKDIDFIY